MQHRASCTSPLTTPGTYHTIIYSSECQRTELLKRTLGGVSNAACSSRIRLADPLTRKVPGTSVAVDYMSVTCSSKLESNTIFLEVQTTAHNWQVTVNRLVERCTALDTPLRHYHRDITPYIKFTVRIRCGYLNIGVS